MDIRAAFNEVNMEVYIQQQAKKYKIFMLGTFFKVLKCYIKKKHLSSTSPLEIF
jgi:hypothetical protein